MSEQKQTKTNLHFHNELVLCDDCNKKAGYGTPIQIHYSNSGGFHPIWEGHKCLHVSVLNIIAYNVKYATSNSIEEKINILFNMKLWDLGKLLTADDCRKLLESV